jgi:hypothetical protein
LAAIRSGRHRLPQYRPLTVRQSSTRGTATAPQGHNISAQTRGHLPGLSCCGPFGAKRCGAAFCGVTTRRSLGLEIDLRS